MPMKAQIRYVSYFCSGTHVNALQPHTHSKKLQQDDEDFEEEEAVQEKYVAPAAPIPLKEHEGMGIMLMMSLIPHSNS